MTDLFWMCASAETFVFGKFTLLNFPSWSHSLFERVTDWIQSSMHRLAHKNIRFLNIQSTQITLLKCWNKSEKIHWISPKTQVGHRYPVCRHPEFFWGKVPLWKDWCGNLWNWLVTRPDHLRHIGAWFPSWPVQPVKSITGYFTWSSGTYAVTF